jgi:hypothetical protein
VKNLEVRANLRLTRIEPYSLIRTGFLVSLSIAVTIITATFISYLVLAGMGVLDSIDALLGDLTGTDGGFSDTFTLPVVFLGSIMLAGFEIVVTTGLVALFGFIYNLTVPFTRGLQVTLAEDLNPEEEVAVLNPKTPTPSTYRSIRERLEEKIASKTSE